MCTALEEYVDDPVPNYYDDAFVNSLADQFSRLDIDNSQKRNSNKKHSRRSPRLQNHSRRPQRLQPKQEPIRFLPVPKRVLKVPRLFNLARLVGKSYIKFFNFRQHISITVTLTQYNAEYEMIANMMPPRIIITRVDKVVNPYLKLSYELKRQLKYNNIVPHLLFHGTKEKYIDNICTYNFDWRFSGAERGHRYGKGVNFTPLPNYASYFCDKTRDQVMILAEVLVSKVAIGRETILLPPKGSDTTIRDNGAVFVKYYDGEFCPLYIIHFFKNK